MDMATIAELAIAALVRVIDDNGRTGNVATADPAKVPMTLLARQTCAAPGTDAASTQPTEGTGL
ncbi:hypothetical protein D3C87_2118330 [compost metagenome]